MNAIQTLLRIEYLNDVTRNARFYFSDINKAVNDVMRVYIHDHFGGENEDKNYSFQSIQQIRSDLSTLVKNYSPLITVLGNITTQYGSFTQNHIDYPTDYYELIAAWPIIDGVSGYCRNINYNEQGIILEHIFKKPTNKKTYINEDSTGWSILRGVGGTFNSIKVEYLRKPADFSIGSESNVISAGGTLVVGSSYIAIDDSVENAISYAGGTQFTAGTVALTSGTVILASLTTPIDLPEKTHEIICKMAAAELLKVISDLPRSQAIEAEANKG